MTDSNYAPDWLPELCLLTHYGGRWNDYVEAVYQLFMDDWVLSSPVLLDKVFRLKRHPLFDNKEATFWHCVSEGNIEVERTPDLRRCERILWPRALVEALDNGRPEVIWWRNERKGKTRLLIAPRDFSYLVVLDERPDYFLLWTAYLIQYRHQRDKQERDFLAYWKAQGQAPP